MYFVLIHPCCFRVQAVAPRIVCILSRLNHCPTWICFEQGPLKGVSKFAEQVSGAVNKNIMGKEEAANPAEEGDQAWEGQEGAEGAATGGPSGAGQEWQSPTDELGMENIWQPPTNGFSEGQELANDVPSELTIDEQVREVCFCSSKQCLRRREGEKPRGNHHSHGQRNK